MRTAREPSLASDSVTLTGVEVARARAAGLLVAAPLLLASDFDGTLAPLVLDPWGARIIPAAQRALRRLAVAPGVHVALISGRTVGDLAMRARIGGVSYRGDHGAERAEAPRGFRPSALQGKREPAAAAEREMAEYLAAEITRAIPETWLVVEHKGAALTLHFRGAPDVEAARERVASFVDATDPEKLLVRSGGRRTLELRPADASTKGDALERLIDDRQPASVIMLGDDHSDALAFDVLRSARDEGRIDGLAVAVAGHADATAEIAPRADLVLASPREAARLLTALAELIEVPEA